METKELWIDYQNQSIYCYCTLPNTDSKKHPTVVFVHGYNGDYTDNLCCSQLLSENGFVGINIDLIGGSDHSRSGTKITETSVMKQLNQVLWVVEEIKKLEFVDEHHIYLYGESQGGLIVSLVAAQLKNSIAGLILMYPAYSLPQLCRSLYQKKEDIEDIVWFLDRPVGRCYLSDIWDLDPYQLIGRYTNPVLLFHGTADDLIKKECSDKASSLYQHCEYHLVENAGHGFYGEDLKRVNQMVLAFVNRSEGAYEK